jgi:hypothetical protein
MQRTLLLACLVAGSVSAQTQTYLIPPNTLPNLGTCNAFPFNTTDMRYQALVRASELGSTPGIISGISFAQCASSGAKSFATITVNLNSPGPALTVLNSVRYVWNVTADVWNDIGLQVPFPYNGKDNLVVEVLVTGRGGVSSATHRDNTNQRVYLGSYTGQLTGTDGGNTAFKMRILMGDASTQSFGAGCAGSKGVPAFSFVGTAQLGKTLGLDCVNLPAPSVALLLMGFDSRLPVFPVDLTAMGAPGCTLYHDIALAIPAPVDASGHAQVGLPIPNVVALKHLILYFSYASMDPPANKAGITTSNYGRALLGN